MTEYINNIYTLFFILKLPIYIIYIAFFDLKFRIILEM